MDRRKEGRPDRWMDPILKDPCGQGQGSNKRSAVISKTVDYFKLLEKMMKEQASSGIS